MRTLKRVSGQKSGRSRASKTSFMRTRADYKTMAVSAVKRTSVGRTSVEEFETKMTKVVKA